MSKLVDTSPEAIYLVVCDDEGCTSSFKEHHEVTWCVDKQNASDVKYIRADLVQTISTPINTDSKGNAVNCNTHPKAPHGFNRNASHNADRYVCDCEGWDAWEDGYQKGVEAMLEERYK